MKLMCHYKQPIKNFPREHLAVSINMIQSLNRLLSFLYFAFIRIELIVCWTLIGPRIEKFFNQFRLRYHGVKLRTKPWNELIVSHPFTINHFAHDLHTAVVGVSMGIIHSSHIARIPCRSVRWWRNRKNVNFNLNSIEAFFLPWVRGWGEVKVILS